MDQREINENEWKNEINWVGPKWYKFYYSSIKDTRLWVPKKPKWVGWTINYGHKYGKLAWSVFVGMMLLLGVLVFIYSMQYYVNN